MTGCRLQRRRRRTTLERGERAKLKVLKLSVVNEICLGVCGLCSKIILYYDTMFQSKLGTWGWAFPARLAPVWTSLDHRWGCGGRRSVCCPEGCGRGGFHPSLPPSPVWCRVPPVHNCKQNRDFTPSRTYPSDSVGPAAAATSASSRNACAPADAVPALLVRPGAYEHCCY